MNESFNWESVSSRFAVIAAWLASIAAWFAVIIQYFYFKNQRKNTFNIKDSEIRKYREPFWTSLREAYHRFQSEQPTAPRELHNLIIRVGPPIDIYPRHGRPLYSWPKEHVDELNRDQALMWDFVSKIYPQRKERHGKISEYSYIDNQLSESFHQARGELANFWNVWAKIISLEYLCDQCKSERDDIILLSWLDIALKQWTPEDRDEGKIYLYKLALKHYSKMQKDAL